MDADGNLLVAELSGCLRTIDREGVASTLAGRGEQGHLDGPLSEARFEQAFGVSVGPAGRIYVPEYAPKKEFRIRVLEGGGVRTLASLPSDGRFRM